MRMVLLVVIMLIGSSHAEESMPAKNENGLITYQSIPLAQRLHIILLGVADIKQSASFYDALGWRRARDSHSGFVKYDLGGFAIALIGAEDLAKDAMYNNPERSGFPGIALIYLAKSSDDVEKILRRAVEAGGELVKPATVTPYGVAGYFRDPDGYLFEVDYEEKFRFTEDYKLITD